ncbi:hypothetical protein AMECASPLE_039412 [Ameca splendens]|uniref:Uncharacterized protein n=1 Tax=Ameca splendens TaxID=208324 RepID=A0ABV0Y8D1_9TELE
MTEPTNSPGPRQRNQPSNQNNKNCVNSKPTNIFFYWFFRLNIVRNHWVQSESGQSVGNNTEVTFQTNTGAARVWYISLRCFLHFLLITIVCCSFKIVFLAARLKTALVPALFDVAVTVQRCKSMT